jgi:hypothetical protein
MEWTMSVCDMFLAEAQRKMPQEKRREEKDADRRLLLSVQRETEGERRRERGQKGSVSRPLSLPS